MLLIATLAIGGAWPLGSLQAQPHDPAEPSPASPPAGETAERDEWSSGSLESDRPPASTPTKSEIEAAMEVLEELHPRLARRVKQLWRQNPDRLKAMMIGHYGPLLRLAQTKQEDPDLYRLRVQDLKLERLTQYHARRVVIAKARGNEAESERAREDFHQAVREHFQIQQALREFELKRLEARVVTLRNRFKNRAEQQNALIADREADLLARAAELAGEGEGADWRSEGRTRDREGDRPQPGGRKGPRQHQSNDDA